MKGTWDTQPQPCSKAFNTLHHLPEKVWTSLQRAVGYAGDMAPLLLHSIPLGTQDFAVCPPPQTHTHTCDLEEGAPSPMHTWSGTAIWPEVVEVREKDSHPKEKEKTVASFSQSWGLEGTGAANNSLSGKATLLLQRTQYLLWAE